MTDTASRVTRWQRLNHVARIGFDAMRRRCASAAVVCAILLIGSAGATSLQAQAATPNPQRASRTELTARVAELERQIAAGGDKKRSKGQLQLDLAAVKSRLEDGDFKGGDRFLITITQDAQTRSDTATVRDSLMVSLVGLPDVSLKGTLRAELNDKLGAHVARFLRNSSVRTIVFTRVAIMGAVSRPGFYTVPPDQPISELLMLAGGTVTDALVNDLQVNRSGKTFLNVKDSRRAFAEGRTLEQLDVQSGDEIKVPLKRKVDAREVIQMLFFASSMFLAIVNFLRFYYQQQQP
jgi:protein involved in polysaccharide export with SLBB domain